MQSIFDFLASMGPWNWFILALVLFMLETVVPGVHFIWFGVAAVIIGAVASYIDIPLQWQLISFGALALSSVTLFLLYTRLWPGAADQNVLNDRGSYYVGRVLEIEEAIVGGRGRARVADGLWSVEGPDMPAGVKVRIVGVKGTALLVEEIR